jgi:hypothetical protein
VKKEKEMKIEIEERIKKDIKKFEQNQKKLEGKRLTKKEKEVFELSKLYKEDSIFYLNKKDYFTSFACISYAHGLLDALLKIKEKSIIENHH